MADLDTDLRNRLSRLADAVPVAPGRLDPVHRSSVAARQSLRMAWLTPLVGLVVVVVGGALLNGGYGPPGGTPITATTRSGDFELTIRSERARYEAGEPVEISASLTYHGAEPVTIVHALGVGDPDAEGGGPLGFGIVEPVIGNLRLETVWLTSRNTTTLAPGASITSPFAKGTATSGSDPRIPEYTAYLEDPVLRLASGTWHPYAIADFSVGEGADVSIRAEIEIQVVAPSNTEASGPTPFADGPVSDSDTNGDFELVIRSPKARYESGQPIEVVAALTYVGRENSATIAHALGARGSALGFGVEEPVLGDLRLKPGWDEACARTELYSDAPQDYQFWKSGSWPGDHPRAAEYHDFVFEPELRLPEGTWHVYAVAEFSIDDCSADPIRMRVDLTIEVGAQAPIDVEETAPIDAPTATPPGADQLPLTTFPQEAAACEQALGGGVLAINDRTGLGFVVEPGEEVDVTWPYGWSAHREDGVAVLVDASGRIVARAGDWIMAGGGWGDGDTFRACELDPWAGTPMELASAREPAEGCYTGFSSGVLGRSPLTGLGIARDPSLEVAPVRWPFGYSARIVHGRAVLFDPDDRVVAWEGGGVGFSGPGAPDGGLIRACGEVIRIAFALTD